MPIGGASRAVAVLECSTTIFADYVPAWPLVSKKRRMALGSGEGSGEGIWGGVWRGGLVRGLVRGSGEVSGEGVW